MKWPWLLLSVIPQTDSELSKVSILITRFTHSPALIPLGTEVLILALLRALDKLIGLRWVTLVRLVGSFILCSTGTPLNLSIQIRMSLRL